MSALTDKYQSYPHYKGISFDESTFTIAPAQTGSKLYIGDPIVMGDFVSNGLNSPTIKTGVLPDQKYYHFDFTKDPDTNASLLYGSTVSGTTGGLNDVRRLFWDGDPSNRITGLWVKMPTSENNIPSVGGLPVFRVLNGTAPIINISVALSSNNLPAIAIIHGINEFTSGPIINFYENYTDTNSNVVPIEWDKWYFVAIRQSINYTSSVNINDPATGTIEFQHFINGESVNTITRTSWTKRSISAIVFGNPVSNFNYSLGASSWFIADYSDIGQTPLREIYNSGIPSPNATIAETPATATAFMTEPTIVIVANDNVQITTSFLASATIPENIVAIANTNINNVVTEILTASADIVNNVQVYTGNDSLNVATEMTASAEFLDARVSEVPMIATATMPNAVPVIQANYFNLVNQLSPYLYINNGLSNPINYGTQTGTFVRGSELKLNQNGGTPMNLVGEGKSWQGVDSLNSDGFLTFETENFADSFNNLLGTGTFAYEVWVKPNAFPETTIHSDTGLSYSILHSEKLSLHLEDYYREAIYSGGIIVGYNVYPRYFSLNINNNLNNKIELRASIDSSPLSLSNWNHIVINVYQSGINANERLVQLWVNGQVIINQTITFTPWSDTTDKINYILGSKAVSLTFLSDMYYDELAIYESPLTNSQIIQHNQFISSISPDYTNFTEPFIASAEFGNHNFFIISNANISQSTATASALFADPTTVAQKTINVSASALEASALNTGVTVFYGRTFVATTMVASAESKEGFFLSDVYYEYVQTNIAPYRYVTFDSENEYLDYGTDNDYSVVSTVVGGTVVTPQFGINGKSAKTAGTSYVTDGVILKESEWNDSWGTGQNSYHSAFWFQRATDDNSTTGLRVLWNLNGYKDNQHVVLYQYQGKLHMQFNNGSGTFVEQDTTALDLFDYQRHFVVVEFDHTNNNNNIVRLYVDAVLSMTVNLGEYTGFTTNAAAADSGPNDELNNHPRLSVGCLITPFSATALPVAPANTKLIIDEVYWDKDSITSTMVTNLFNIMPDKTNKIFIVEAITASAEFVMPAFSTSSILTTSPFTASAEVIEPVTTADREVVAEVEPVTANAELLDPAVFEDKIIFSDIFVATATFNNAGLISTIPGPTMNASARLQSSALSLNVDGSTVYPNLSLSPWITYLRATETNKILPMREVV